MKDFIRWLRYGAILMIMVVRGAESDINPIGVWEGKWDGTWKVRYTISQGEKGAYRMIYEWEENLGGAMSKSTNNAARLKDGVLKVDVIEIKFRKDGTALAKGNFEKPRTAFLKRKTPAQP